MTAPAGDRPPIRIGNAEREAGYQALDAHLSQGRIDVEEYGDRYAKASVARTRDELTALFVDLPAPHPFPDPSQPSWDVPRPEPTRRRGYGFVPRAFPVLPIVALVLFLTGGWWIGFLLIPLFFGVFGGGRRYGYGRRARWGCW